MRVVCADALARESVICARVGSEVHVGLSDPGLDALTVDELAIAMATRSEDVAETRQNLDFALR